MNYTQNYYTQAVGGLGNYGSYWSGRPPEHLTYPNSAGSAYMPQFGQEPVVPPPPPPPTTTPDPLPPDFVSPTSAGGLVAGLGGAYLAAIVAVAVAVNYQLGKAMAPSKDKEAKWAWGNAIGGTLVPPVTVGLAIYKNYFTD